MMSVEGQVLSASTFGGGGAAAISSLADTGNPAVVGVAVGIILVVALGLVTRAAQRS